jgi:hypothetical protein
MTALLLYAAFILALGALIWVGDKNFDAVFTKTGPTL